MHFDYNWPLWWHFDDDFTKKFKGTRNTACCYKYQYYQLCTNIISSLTTKIKLTHSITTMYNYNARYFKNIKYSSTFTILATGYDIQHLMSTST